MYFFSEIKVNVEHILEINLKKCRKFEEILKNKSKGNIKCSIKKIYIEKCDVKICTGEKYKFVKG